MTLNAKDPISETDLVEFLNECSLFAGVKNASSSLLAGDGSGRSFYRINCKEGKRPSAVLLFTPAGIGPKLSGDQSYSQEQAFVELCRFFPESGIPTPVFYGYDSQRSWVLMEDIGNLALFKFLSPEETIGEEGRIDEIKNQLGSDPVISLFQKAIKLIATLQKIPPNKEVIAFRRYLGFENYRAEIAEFSDYYAKPKGLQRAAALELDAVYDAICETIMSFPKALSLFDYNAHNLFVSSEGELKVLDFQDSCMVSPARDLVSLINDRGMDELLGKNRHNSLLRYALDMLDCDGHLDSIYNFTLLHWDLRVAGRFVKLNEKFKTDKYQKWIPSTLRRLGRTLKRTENTIHGINNLLEIAYNLSPEVREGFADGWDFPEAS